MTQNLLWTKLNRKRSVDESNWGWDRHWFSIQASRFHSFLLYAIGDYKECGWRWVDIGCRTNLVKYPVDKQHKVFTKVGRRSLWIWRSRKYECWKACVHVRKEVMAVEAQKVNMKRT